MNLMKSQKKIFLVATSDLIVSTAAKYFEYISYFGQYICQFISLEIWIILEGNTVA